VQIVSWAALHVFGREAPLSLGGNSASGDDLFGWATHLCLLVFAMLATVVWSLLDRRLNSYPSLHKWFRVFIRFSLAGQMLNYGFAKVFPSQMPFLLARLVEPFGAFSPMGVLWSFMSASQPYEIFVGCAEVLGGILLILPQTTTLGALICMVDMTQVFILNMTYDVPVKSSRSICCCCLFFSSRRRPGEWRRSCPVTAMWVLPHNLSFSRRAGRAGSH
jgi:uncharacterized membrane protein YphA (DoxX/SURF4 family)